MSRVIDTKLRFPIADVPTANKAIEIANGVFWLRFPLPFRLDHVNIYLIEDGDGYAVIDTGIDNESMRLLWRSLLAEWKITRIVITHHHPDHLGLAGWLAEDQGLPLIMTRLCHEMWNELAIAPNITISDEALVFYQNLGVDADAALSIGSLGVDYINQVSPITVQPEFIEAGAHLTIGSRRFEVMTGDGHAPGQLMLLSASDNLLFSADQVLPEITPNIGVWSTECEVNPLAAYLESLRGLSGRFSGDVLVLPGHRKPFVGMHERCLQIIAHHDERCRLIEVACASAPQTIRDLIGAVFSRRFESEDIGFALSEVLAHVNHMLALGSIEWKGDRLSCA